MEAISCHPYQDSSSFPVQEKIRINFFTVPRQFLEDSEMTRFHLIRHGHMSTCYDHGRPRTPAGIHPTRGETPGCRSQHCNINCCIIPNVLTLQQSIVQALLDWTPLFECFNWRLCELMRGVDVFAERLRVVVGFVTDGTRVVVQR